MAEAVDSVIAEFVIKGLDQYESSFNRAAAAHTRFAKTVNALKGQTFDLQAEGQKYKAGTDLMASGEEQAAAKITKARKQRSDAATQASATEARAAKASADAVTAAETKKQAALEATARKRGSVSVASDLFSAGGGVKPGTGALIGVASETGDRSAAARQTETMRQTRVEAQETAVAETEINAAMVEQIRLQAGLIAARGEDRNLIREQISDMRTYNQLLKTGLTEEAAAVELETIRASRVKARTEQEAAASRKSSSTGLRQAVEGATLGYAPSGAAFAGVAAAGIAAGAVAAVAAGVDYGKQIKDTADAIGLTTRQVQIYQVAARDAGVSTDQFRSGIGQLNAYLGKAKSGDEQAGKTFAALGISIKDAASAGDVLPTLIDRISSIKDPAQRAALETRLFGEEGRRLDALLSGGNDKVNELAAGLERTGAILSSSDIAKLDDVSKKLAEVKAQLQVDLAETVANNAGAIEHLAESFEHLVDKIGSAITAYDKLANSPFGKIISTVNSYDPTKLALNAIDRGLNGNKSTVATKVGENGNSVSLDIGDVQPGKANGKAIDSLFAPKPHKGKSAASLAAEAEQRTKRFNDELARYQDQELSAQADMTGDIQERASIESALSERAANRAKKDIDSQAKINIDHGANADLEHARAAILKAAVDQGTQAESAAREQQVTADLSKQANDHLQTRLSIEAELLDGTQEFARTSAERLAIQLRLLEIEKQQERANLQNQIDTAKPGSDLTDVRAQLGSLDSRYASKAAVAAHQNLGPLAAYADSLPRTAGEVQEAFEKAAVNGVEALNSGLDKSVAKALHLHGIAGQILSDFIDIGLKAAEAQIFGGSGGGGGLGGLGSLLGGIGSLFGGGGGAIAASNAGIAGALGASNASGFAGLLGSLPGLAGGGSFDILGNGGVDRNVMSINGRPVARVNMGETVNISPAGTNAKVYPPSAAMTLHQTIQVDGRNSVTPSDFAERIVTTANHYADQAAAKAGASAVRAAPGQVKRVQTLGN